MAILESQGIGSGIAVAADQADVHLVERARAGDVAAFDAIVAARQLPTFRLVRAILGSTEESEDATQDAFIAAWRALPTLRRPERFDAWFGRIVVNSCRMSLRRRPRAVVVSLDEVVDGHPSMTHDGEVIELIDGDALSRAIDQLPIQQRAILALYYLEDRPLSSVARILGIPAGTVKWRLWRARIALRRLMDADTAPAAARPRMPTGGLAG